ncbi:TPA: glycosyltransferase family 4 protein [Vibrio vulnificus]|nr:glycosyltransferase family 4 protein [Vibrio vulnificus]
MTLKVDIVSLGSVKSKTGVGTFLNEFVTNFKSDAIDLSVITRDRYENSISNIGKQNKKTNIASMIVPEFKNIFGSLTLYFSYFRHALKLIVKYEKDFEFRKPDIIHFQEPFTCFVFLKLFGNKLKSSKVFMTQHTNGELWKMLKEYHPNIGCGISGMLLRYVESFVFSSVDRIGFVSEFSKYEFVKKYPEFNEKTFFCYNGVGAETNFINKNPNRVKKFICVGTINSRKNQTFLLDCLSSLDEIYRNNIELSFAGGGPMLVELMEKKERLGLNNVEFLGEVNNVQELLLDYDIFVLPSKDEGLPIAIIEAMRCGLPILSTPVGGIPEMVKDNGFLVDLNISEWKEVMCSILNDDEITLEMSKKSCCYYNQMFTYDSMFKSYLEVWNKNRV